MLTDSSLPAHYMYAYGCSYSNTNKLQQQAELKKSIVTSSTRSINIPCSNTDKIKYGGINVQNTKQTVDNVQLSINFNLPKRNIKRNECTSVSDELWNNLIDYDINSMYYINNQYSSNNKLDYGMSSYKASFRPLLVHHDTLPSNNESMNDSISIQNTNIQSASMADTIYDSYNRVPRSRSMPIQSNNSSQYINSVDSGHKFKHSINDDIKQSVWVDRIQNSDTVNNDDAHNDAFELEL